MCSKLLTAGGAELAVLRGRQGRERALGSCYQRLCGAHRRNVEIAGGGRGGRGGEGRGGEGREGGSTMYIHVM